jgi:hypothetical protein
MRAHASMSHEENQDKGRGSVMLGNYVCCGFVEVKKKYKMP